MVRPPHALHDARDHNHRAGHKLPWVEAVLEEVLVRPDDAGGDGSVGANLQAEIKGRKRKEYFSNFPSSDWTGCQSVTAFEAAGKDRASDARKKR